MFWIAVVIAGLVLLALAKQKRGAQKARAGWLVGLAAIALPMLAMRFGSPALVALGPLAAGLIWNFMQQRRRNDPSSDVAPGARPLRRMTREEALRVLGLKEGASREEIAAAHRQLIKRLHPDQGGSGFLLQQVNEAKKVLESS